MAAKLHFFLTTHRPEIFEIDLSLCATNSYTLLESNPINYKSSKNLKKGEL